MCEAPSYKLKPDPYSQHSTSTYAYRVTIEPKVCGGSKIFLKLISLEHPLTLS